MDNRPGMLRVTLVLILTVALGGCASDGTKPSAGPSEPKIEGIETFGKLSQKHVEGTVSYPQSPPVGGSHAAKWQNCGFYREPVRNENAVHSLEHGAVWLAYRQDLPQTDLDKLRAFAQKGHVLVSPYPGLRQAVVATAWERQLRLDSVDDPRLQQFVDAYREGPQTPEPGAPCDRGIGQPEA